MIEQRENKLILTFPTADSATTFAVFLESLVRPSQPSSNQPSQQGPEIFAPPSGQSPESSNLPPSEQATFSVPVTPAFPEPARSRRVVLTPERQDQLSAQREAGLTSHQRQLRAQTTLRDGTLPFRALQQPPQPSGQESPRMKAGREGGFADGSGAQPEAGRRKSRLVPVRQSPKP